MTFFLLCAASERVKSAELRHVKEAQDGNVAFAASLCMSLPGFVGAACAASKR